MSPPGAPPRILGFISVDAAAWLVAVVVCTGGLVSTGLIAWSSYDSFQRQLRQRFELLAGERFTRIEERFVDQVQRLDGLRRFIVGSEVVSRNEFNGYVKPLLGRTVAYTWAPRITRGERAAFERDTRAEGIAGFSIRDLAGDGQLVPAAERDEYLPVFFTQSEVQAGVPLGYDMLTNEPRRQTFERAKVSDGFTLSPPIALLGLKELDSRGMLMVAPVIGPSRGDPALARPVQGFVSAIISVPLLMTDGLPTLADDNLQVRIRDLSAVPADALLFQSPVAATELDLSAIHFMTLGSRSYEIMLRPSDVFAHANRSSAQLTVLLLGSLLSVLLSTLLYSLISQRQRALALVHERTTQLQERDRLLQKLSAEVPGGIYQYLKTADDVDRFTYASRGLLDIFELSTQDLVHDSRRVLERLHPDDLDEIHKSINWSREHLSRWREEFRVLVPRAGLRWVRGEATPERLDDGGTLWHGYFTDISDLKRVEEELRALSITDALTGIYNRRYFQERLKSELSRAERDGSNLSVIMLDIDHFKQINDQHGHAEGDRVLQALCHRIAQRLRRGDVFCRLGGEEFMVLCPGSSGEQAYALALELWQGLRSVPTDGVGVITASFGIASWRPGEGADTLLLRADSGVYAAKQAGRDRVQAELA
jgi:diguanylate cyclase (GGDEF)-like protein